MGGKRRRRENGPQILRLAPARDRALNTIPGMALTPVVGRLCPADGREPSPLLVGQINLVTVGTELLTEELSSDSSSLRRIVYFRSPTDWPVRSLSAFVRTFSISCFSSTVNLSPASFNRSRAVRIERGKVTSCSLPGTIL
jgi:hypothetical protein